MSAESDQNATSIPTSGTTLARTPSRFAGTTTLKIPKTVSRQRFTRPPTDTS